MHLQENDFGQIVTTEVECQREKEDVIKLETLARFTISTNFVLLDGDFPQSRDHSSVHDRRCRYVTFTVIIHLSC